MQAMQESILSQRGKEAGKRRKNDTRDDQEGPKNEKAGFQHDCVKHEGDTTYPLSSGHTAIPLSNRSPCVYSTSLRASTFPLAVQAAMSGSFRHLSPIIFPVSSEENNLLDWSAEGSEDT